MNKVIGIIMLALLGVSITSLATPVAEAERGNRVADWNPLLVYIERINLTINRVLAIAFMYNITLPENLATEAEKAKELIAQAYEAAQVGNETDALKLATAALKTFAPVTVYVWRHIPVEARENYCRVMLEKAIRLRLQKLEKLKTMVWRMIEENVTVPKRLIDKLQLIEQVLEQARMQLRNGNYENASQLVKHATAMLREATGSTRQCSHRLIHAISSYAMFAGIVGKITVYIDRSIELTIQALENNRTNEALIIVNRTMTAIEDMKARLQRVVNMMRQHNINDTYMRPIEYMTQILNTIQDYLVQAKQAIEEGNTTLALALLIDARETLNSSIEGIREIKLPQVLRKFMHQVRRRINTTDEANQYKLTRVFTHLAKRLDRIMARLQCMHRQYLMGIITEQEYIHQLEEIAEKLSKLKENLPPTTPNWIIEKIDTILEWIKENTPEE